MRLIDAEGSELQTQLKIIREAEYQIYGSGSWGFTAKCERAIEDAPTIEPETGHWILKSHMWECDKCGCRIRRANPFKGNIWNYNFCPNCGAKMEKK